MRKISRTVVSGAIASFLLVLAACAPTAQAPAPGNGPQFAQAVSQAEEPALQTARAIWHEMELGRLQTGSYTSNVLIELTDLPPGVAFMMESFPGESFEMRVTDDALPGIYWLVNPAGVTRHELLGQSVLFRNEGNAYAI